MTEITPTPGKKDESALSIVNLNLERNIKKWIENKNNIYIGDPVELQGETLDRSRWFFKFDEMKQYIDFLKEWDLYLDIPDLKTYNLGYATKQGFDIATALSEIYSNYDKIFGSKKPRLRKFFPIIGLMHGLDPKVAYSVVKHGLKTWRELDVSKSRFVGLDIKRSKGDQRRLELGTMPGVYFDPIFYQDRGKFRRGRTRCNLIVDPYVLNRRDWHVTIGDAFGAINYTSASLDGLPHFLNRLNLKPYSVIEFVFHNQVETEFIREFIDNACDFFNYDEFDPDNYDSTDQVIEERVEELEKEQKKLGETWINPAGHTIKNSYYSTDQKIIHSVYLPLIEKPRFERFCLANSYDPKSLFMNVKNCGMTNQEIQTLCYNVDKEECFKRLRSEKYERSEQARFKPETDRSYTIYSFPFERTTLTTDDQKLFETIL